MAEKTHYRKAFNSPYLSSADIVEPTVFTVSHVRLEPDKAKKTKAKLSFNTAYFREKEVRPGEKLKPMILNVGNSLVMKTLSGSPFIDDWNDIPVTIYADPSVKFGNETVGGLRISPEPPKTEMMELTPNMGKAWQNAVAAYKRDKNFDAIEKRMVVSKENKNKIAAEVLDVA